MKRKIAVLLSMEIAFAMSGSFTGCDKKEASSVNDSSVKMTEESYSVENTTEESVVETEESTSTNGSISGIVTDESGNPIEGATVTAVSTLSDTLANKTATTGADGSYEITCDAGNYKLKVTADGYDDYECDDVLNVETKLDTLADTIILTVSVKVPDIVQAVLENTELITEILTERQEAESNIEFVDDIHGENQIWFQDMDMDGDVEFIVRLNGFPDGGDRPYLIFDIDDNGNLYNATAVTDYGYYEAYNVSFCDDSDASLWYDKTKGEYCYLLPDHGFSIVRAKLYYLELDENGYSQSEILWIYDTDYYETEEGFSEGGVTIEGDDDNNVSYAEAIAYYDAYFENLIGYQTTVQKISMEDYVSMSDEEKLAVLTESYNAWSYTEDNSIERPLADVIDELRDKVEATESAIPNTAVQWSDSSYQLFDNVVDTYEEAAAYCESLGGHLAIIGSKEENDYLYDYVTSLGYENAYFGYTDKDNEGEWLCIDGSNADYTNWHSGEPNSENSLEDYAMFYYKFSDGTWNDGDFGDGGLVNDSKAFICEWD